MTPQSIGRYQVFAQLGEGGFATVYRAYDPRLDRDVAVKVLHRNHAADERMRARFLREGKALARVQHPHLVRLFDSGEVDGMVYLTMEFIPGRSLADLATEQTFDLAAVQPILAQIAGALDALHEAGLLHRDIKPANIMLRDDGRAVLVDLGVAGLADAAGPTTRNMILGTPGFLAPEQVAGSAGADRRTDVYQLAATAYTLLAGRPPFQGEAARALYAVAHESPPGLHELCPDLPKAVCAVIDRALAKDPTQRPARASELAALLTDAALPPTLLLPRRSETLPAADVPEATAPTSLARETTAAPAAVAPLRAPARKHRSGRRALFAAAVGAALILFGGGATIVGTARGGDGGAKPAARLEWQQANPSAAVLDRDADERRHSPRINATGRSPEAVTTMGSPTTEAPPAIVPTATPSPAQQAMPTPKPSPSPASTPSPPPSLRPTSAPSPPLSPSPTPAATSTPPPSPSPSPDATPSPKPATPARGGYGGMNR